MDVSQLLSQMYNTPAATQQPQQEGTAKFAHAELFAKLAEDQGIDLTQLSPEQTEGLYNKVFNKTAGEMPPQFAKKDGDEKGKKDDDKDDDEKKAAAAYLAEKRAFAEKLAEADFMGRAMAHSFLDEFNKLGGIPPQFMAGKKDDDDKGEKKDDDKDEKKKESAAATFESLARRHAVEIAKEAGYNPTEVQKKVDAIAELGLLEESQKIAGVQETDLAIAIRALEYLEKVGFQINWKEALQG